MQKLAYFCHGWSLALREEPIVDELFEAWRLGPVLGPLYHTLRVFSIASIPADHPFIRRQPRLSDACCEAKLIERVLEVYGKLSTARLSSISRMDGGPWELAWHGSSHECWISNESIHAWFDRIAHFEYTPGEHCPEYD
ncbi:putative phage-associated protein [Paraburkholderia sp. HC6.4b]|uniref:Panacea domain-containing protein n=1 Tax=unclassified Paraburkholderia TaxID=2615204 RepID=UPI0017F06C44|nr:MULTISPECIES: type II toxin-antitoxin system antitoxin SocA domain-containing protein [unclassified Paraburkholderia]MBB5409152.1 putative phage-associated protein [Paraburkholderia sp. HC6.4b]MBB5450880.1 putative phage-associated protein [Paraburkholderia sp. Kb1A]